MIEFIVMTILGVTLTVLGIVNIAGNISTIHSYNRKNVTENNQKAYGRFVGSGTASIGVSLIITGILQIFCYKEYWFFILLVGTIIGILLILYAQFKYNKGIF